MERLANVTMLAAIAAFAVMASPFLAVAWAYRAAELRFAYDGDAEQRERDEYNAAWQNP